jgi:Domain of Unknown Function (DUF928)
MKFQKLPLLKVLILLLVFLVFPNVLAQTSPASSSTSQTTKKNKQNSRKANLVKFKIPPKGAPGRRADGGSRSECSVLDKGIIALIPATNIGLTISERPTFWFYIPYSASVNNSGKFQLLSEQDVVYETNIQIVGTPGIIGINLPKDSQKLETNKKYRWIFSYNCNKEAPVGGNLSVNGSVERVPIARGLKKKLESAKTPEEKIALYAENGLWYDLLAVLVSERQLNPQNVQLENAWKDLLEQTPEVQLNVLVRESVVSCCQIKE